MYICMCFEGVPEEFLEVVRVLVHRRVFCQDVLDHMTDLLPKTIHLRVGRTARGEWEGMRERGVT